MENYLKRFQYNLQRSKLRQSGKDTLKKLLLKGIKNEYLEILNMMGTCDVFQLPYDVVCELRRRISRGKFKTGKSIPSSQFLKSTTGIGVTRAEIGDLFKILESDIISSLNSQINILHVGENEEFEGEFFHQWKKKHITKDFPLDSLRICSICSLNHSMGSLSSLPRMETTCQGDMEVVTSSPYEMAPELSWESRPTCMVQSSIPPFPYSHNQSMNIRTP